MNNYKGLFNKHLINRYLALTFLKSFVWVFFAFLGIIFLITLMEKVKEDVPFHVIALSIFYDLPLYFSTLLPFSILLVSMFVMWRFEKTSELIVIRSVGVSVWQFTMPLVVSVFLLGVFYTTVINPLSTRFQILNSKLAKKYGLRGNDLNFVFTKQGFWLREQSDNINSFVYCSNINQVDNRLEANDITVFQLDEKQNFLRRIEAKSGVAQNGIFKLKDVLVVNQKDKFKQDEYEYNTTLSPKKVIDNMSLPEAVSFWQLPRFINFFRKNGFPVREYEMMFARLVFLPFFLCSMLMFGIIFSLSKNVRSAKAFSKILSGIGLGFLVYFLDQIITTMGQTGSLLIVVATVSVPFLVTLTSVSFLLFTEDG